MPDNPQTVPLPPDIRRGRLQRAPSATGHRVSTFANVLKRHGLTMACFAAVSLMIPDSWPLIVTTTEMAREQPLPYLAGLLGMLLFFAYWSTRRPYTIRRQCQWLFYLLMISIVEELTFRLVLPTVLSLHYPVMTAHILSNLVFASLHYITLRWRLVNCVATFAGGMGLSHLMGQGDLVLVVMVHWLGTFLNTPSPPSKKI
jgi:membrane protease YdiL (CAAX protease family)